jgi:uncharacterized membrane protein
MSSIRNNRSIWALIMLMLVSASLHMVLLALHFVITLDYTPFNFFRIIGFDLFYPTFVASDSSWYISVITVVGIYLFAYLFLVRQKK